MKQLAELVLQHALEVRGDDEPPFLLKGGGTSHYYLDLRRLTLTAIGAKTVAGALWRAVGDFSMDYQAIGGSCVGADPIIGAMLCQSYDLRGFLVRSAAKEHGKGGRVIGSVRPGDHCILIEDVVTTGGSSMSAVSALETEVQGARVILALAVLDRLQGAAAAFQDRGIPFRSLLTIRDLGLEVP